MCGTQKKCLNEKLHRAPKTHVKNVKTDGNLTLIDVQFHTRENKYINYNKLINNNHVTCTPISNAAEVISSRSTLFCNPLYTSDS